MTDKITTEEAMKRLEFLRENCPYDDDCVYNGECEGCRESVKMAIEALEEKYEREQPPCYRCVDNDHCEYCIYGSRLG